MLWNEITSAICICCSAIIYSLSLQSKVKIKILFIQMFSSILYILSYIFALNVNSASLIGVIIAGFEFIRLIVFYIIERNEKYNTKAVNTIAVLIFLTILTTCTIFAWSGWISVFPLVGTILVTISLGCKEVLLIKISCVIQTILITIYLVFLSLWINAISQVFVLIFGIVGLITYLIQNKKIKLKVV